MTAVKVRVFYDAGAPDAEPRRRWRWRCDPCLILGLCCEHDDDVHPAGGWRSAVCGGFHHAHTIHPRPAERGPR